jgi:hypothetical protein
VGKGFPGAEPVGACARAETEKAAIENTMDARGLIWIYAFLRIFADGGKFLPVNLLHFEGETCLCSSCVGLGLKMMTGGLQTMGGIGGMMVFRQRLKI